MAVKIFPTPFPVTYILVWHQHEIQFSRLVLSNSLRPHESQHARPPCPSPTPGVHSESVMPSSHLILCRPLLLLPLILPSIRVFSNESTLLMRWPKYWSFSFSIIPSKEIPGLIWEVPKDPAVPFWGIDPEKTIIWKDRCIPMFMAALWTIAKAWKQPKWIRTCESANKTGYSHTEQYHWATKRVTSCHVQQQGRK